MVGCHFVYSKTEDDIYELMEAYMMGSDLYQFDVCDAIQEYFIKEHKLYQLCCSPYYNDTRFGVCSISWVEDTYPKMIVFDYRIGDI